MAEYNLGTARGRIELDASGVKKGTDKASRHMKDFEKDAKSSMDSVSTKFKNLGGKMRSAGKGMSQALTLPLVAIGGASMKAASDAEEMRSKFSVVFDDLADDVESWAGQHAEAVNRSKTDIMGYMAQLQDTFVPMGFAREEAAEMSKEVTELGIDLASFNNMAEDEAIRKLQRGLLGSHENLQQFGVTIKQATLDQELMNMGIEDGVNAASEQEKMMARMNLVIAGTADAQGDAARTSDSFANQMRGVKADMEEVAIGIGEQLIPMFQGLIDKVQGAFQWFTDLSDGQQRIIVIVGMVVGALGPLLVILGMITQAIGALIPVVSAITLPMIAWVAGIAALVAALVWAWNNVDWFREGIKSAWDSITSRFQQAWEELQVIWDALVAAVRWVGDTWTAVFEAVVGFFQNTFMPAFRSVRDTVLQVFDTIGNIIAYVWSRVVYPILRGAARFLKNTFAPVFNFLADIVEGAFNNITDGIKFAWNRIIKPLFNGVKGFIENTFVPVWETMGDVITGIWETIRDTAKDVWNGITSTIGDAVNGVIRIVNAFISGINKIADAIGLGTLIGAISEVAVEAATYHKGGIVGKDGGPKKELGGVRGDEEVAILKRGELVLAPEDAARFMEMGGPFDFAKDMVGNAWESVKDAAGNVVGKVREVAAKVARPLIENALDGLNAIVGGVGPFGEIVGGTTRRISDEILDWIEGVEDEVKARGGTIPDAAGMPFNRLIAYLSNNMADSAFRVTSTLRNGPGGSLHNVGRAADFAGPAPGRLTPQMRQIWEVFSGVAGNLRELIYTGAPWGILGGKRVATSSMSSFLRRTHEDHVHAALRNGGIIDRPTMALMGEYANARTNPEIVSPVELMRSVVRGELSKMQGGQGLTVGPNYITQTDPMEVADELSWKIKVGH